MEKITLILSITVMVALLPGNICGGGRGRGVRGVRMPACQEFDEAYGNQLRMMFRNETVKFKKCRRMEDDEEMSDCMFENMMMVKNSMDMTAPKKCMDQVSMMYLQPPNGGSDMEQEREM